MQTLTAQLFRDVSPKKMLRGQILLYEGDPITDLFYITEGYIKVYSILNTGIRNTIFIYGPGDVFPIRTILSGLQQTLYFYEAMTDSVIFALPVSQFNQKMVGNLDGAEKLIRYISQLNEEYTLRIDMLSVNDARRKIVALLSYLVDKVGSNSKLSSLELPLTQQDIADLCGITRETASIQLNKLRRSGIITNNRNLLVNRVKLDQIKSKLTIS